MKCIDTCPPAHCFLFCSRVSHCYLFCKAMHWTSQTCPESQCVHALVYTSTCMCEHRSVLLTVGSLHPSHTVWTVNKIHHFTLLNRGNIFSQNRTQASTSTATSSSQPMYHPQLVDSIHLQPQLYVILQQPNTITNINQSNQLFRLLLYRFIQCRVAILDGAATRYNGA